MNINIKLSGRIDSASASHAEKEIEQQLSDSKAASTDKVLFDCTDLQYISSTGLRILLKYKKLYPDFEVINLSNDIYNVFEMTGFSKIMTVKKALRVVSIAGCEEIARGGVGIIYRYDEDTIIKVFSADCSLDIPERERVMARESFVLGMPTAIPYDIVWVPETKSYGMMTELINAKTLGAAVKANPENYRYYASLFGKMLRDMHEIQVLNGSLPDAIDVHLSDFERIARHFTPEEIELMKTILLKIPKGNSLLHCDCHPKNVMIKGESGSEELILIDMGEVSYGNPLIELLHTSSTFHVSSGFEAIVGFPDSLQIPFWKETLKAYFGTDDEQVIDEYDAVIGAAAIVRSISWIALSYFPQEVIDGVRKIADEKLWKNKDYYLAMTEKFKEYFPGTK